MTLSFQFGTVGSPIGTPKKPGGTPGGILRLRELKLDALELAWVQSVRVSDETCAVIKSNATYEGKQGFTYDAGISAESVGATGLCMHMLRIPPGGRARVHLHESHETAIYVLNGQGEMWFGDDLEHHVTCGPGDMIYIPKGSSITFGTPSWTKFVYVVFPVNWNEK